MRRALSEVGASLRGLRRDRPYALATVFCFALGAGCLAAAFAVVDSTLIRELPYPAAERLVTLWNSFPGRSQDREPLSEAELVDYRQRLRGVESLAGLLPWRFNLSGNGDPEQLVGARVSAAFWPLLGVRAQQGRGFSRDEEDLGAAVVVLTDRLWRRRFGADPEILGQPLTLNGSPHLVIGVLPASFRLPGESFEIFAPLTMDPTRPMPRDARAVLALGRLAAGSSLGVARAELEVLAQELGREHPEVYSADAGWSPLLISWREQIVGEARAALLLQLGAALLVLGAAAANVLNLLSARASGRVKEMAIRSALGARRGELLRPFLIEASLLTTLGGALGLLLAGSLLALLLRLGAQRVPRAEEIGVGAATVALILVLSLSAGLCCGWIAALWARRRAGPAALAEASERVSAGRASRRIRALLVAAQVAMAVVVLAGCGLLAGSFLAVRSIDLGFEPANLLTLEIFLPREELAAPGASADFFERLTAELLALPGVRGAAAVSDLPFSGSDLGGAVLAEGAAEPAAGLPPPVASWRIVTPAYFDTVGIELERGRGFEAADRAGGQSVVVVDRRLAAQLWPGQEPLGKRLSLGDWADSSWLTVVGVVAPVRHSSLTTESRQQLYLPQRQAERRMMSVVVRTQGEPMLLAPAVERRIWALAPRQPVTAVQPMARLVAAARSDLSFNLGLFVVLTVVAVALALLGIYALTAYTVAERRWELGLRLALGALPADVLRLVLGQSLRQIGLGIVVGLAIALGSSRLLESQLFGVAPSDPATLAAVTVLLVVTGGLASWWPARQVLRIEPQLAMRPAVGRVAAASGRGA